MPQSVKKPAAKRTKPAAKKVPAVSRAPKKSPAARKPSVRAAKSAAVRTVTVKEISVEAYYIAERRQRLRLPGDAQSDWLEAERRLRD